MKRHVMRRFGGSLFLAAVIGLLCLTPARSAQEEFKGVTWIYQSSSMPASGCPTYLNNELPKLVSEATNGKVNIVWRQGMYSNVEWLWPLSKNVVQIAQVYAGLFSTSITEWKLATLPFLFQNDEEFNKFIAGGGAKMWMEDVFARYKLNLKHLFTWTNGSQNLWTPRPVKTIADWKGFKLRVIPEASPVVADIGASPTNVPFEEIALALDRGVIDGVVIGDLVAVGGGYHRKCPYTNRWPLLSCFPMSLFVNNDALNALPRDLQGKVLDVLNKAGQRVITEIRAADIAKTDARMKEVGVTVITPNAEDVKKAEGMSQKYVKKWAEEKPEHMALLRLFEKTSGRKVLP